MQQRSQILEAMEGAAQELAQLNVLDYFNFPNLSSLLNSMKNLLHLLRNNLLMFLLFKKELKKILEGGEHQEKSRKNQLPIDLGKLLQSFSIR